RMAQVREQLQALPATPVNRDFAPIAYYFSIELWSAQFHAAYARWLRAAAGRRFGSVVVWGCALLLLVAVLLANRPVHQERARAAASIQFLLAASASALIFLIAVLARTSGAGMALLTAQVVFPALAALSGMLGGYQFPVATEIWLPEGSAPRGLGT